MNGGIGLEGLKEGWLLAGIADSETNFAHCWSEATWACKGPASSDCGGGPVIAGAGDGPCSIKQGGLGLFQFDGGTHSQTLARNGRKVLTVAGSTQEAIKFVTRRVEISRYISGVSNRQQALKWMNGVRPGNARFTDWIKTVTHYYNGCKPSYGCWNSRFARYKRYAEGMYREMGASFWDKCSSGPSETWDAGMSVRWSGVGERVGGGSSEGIGDVFPGERFKAVIKLKNKSSEVWHNVRVGYLIEEPWLKAVDYNIESDHPKYDQKSWRINSADGNSKNPAKSKLGKKGRLEMDAFSPKETKRVVITLEATRYSIGYHPHPDVRGWLWHIDGVYGEQGGYHDKPSNGNKFGKRVRGYAQLDVFDRDQWMFRGSKKADREGWTGRGPHEGPVVEQQKNMLRLKVTGDDAGVVSPKWTRVDPARWDQLVLRLRSHDGPHTVAVYFSPDGQGFSEKRVVRFEVPGDGRFHRWVVPMSKHPEWDKGTVKRLRIDPWDDGNGGSGAGGDSEWFEISQVYAQNSSKKRTSAWSKDYGEATRVTLEREMMAGGSGTGGTSGGSSGSGGGSGTSGGSAGNGSGGTGGGSGTSGTGEPSGPALGAPPARGGSGGGGGGASGGSKSDELAGEPGAKSIRATGSCSAAGGGGGAVPVWVVVVFASFWVYRRTPPPSAERRRGHLP